MTFRDIEREIAATSHGEYDGTTCPNCRSSNITGESIEPTDASSASRNCSCEDCHAIWVECLHVVGFSDLEIVAN